MSRRHRHAELAPDGFTMRCSSCLGSLGLRFYDPARAEYFLFLDEDWTHDRESGTWRAMHRAAKAQRLGQRGTRRNLDGYAEPLGHIPYNLPLRLECRNCGTAQVADPDRLHVSANPSPLGEAQYDGPVAFEIPRANVERALRHTAATE